MSAKRWFMVALTFVCATSISGQRHSKNSESALEDGCGPGLPYLSGCYLKTITRTPTLTGKVDYLARIADSSQIQIGEIKAHINLAEAANTKDINGLWKQIDLITPPVPPAKTVSDVQNLRQDIEDLRSQFEEFRDVACPAIQSARLDPKTRMRLDLVCASR
jgi:hypothetical protein